MLDLVLVILKLLSQVPALYDKYLLYKADQNYKNVSERLSAAFNDFVKAKAAGDIQGQLNALNNVVKPK